MGKRTLCLEPPPVLVPPVGRCRWPELVAHVIPLRLRQHQVLHPCFERAVRQVAAGLQIVEPVCLWHSLVATQRLGAHLIRSATTGARP